MANDCLSVTSGAHMTYNNGTHHAERKFIQQRNWVKPAKAKVCSQTIKRWTTYLFITPKQRNILQKTEFVFFLDMK